MGTIRMLLCLALMIVIVTQAEGKAGRRFGSRRSSMFGSRRSRFGSGARFSRSRHSIRGGSRMGGTLLKGAALGVGVWSGWMLTKGAANMASAAMNPFANLYPNPQVAFQNWNSWRQQDGMLCRNDNDCKWLDPQMNCQMSAIPPTPGNPNWFGGGAELQNIRGECQCPPTFQFITTESRSYFGCSNDINEFDRPLPASKMAAFKHTVALSGLVVVAGAINEGDVDGSLGYRLTFKHHHGLDYLVHVRNVEPEECCAACKKTEPETEIFDFRREDGVNVCVCAKRDPSDGHEKLITISTRGWSAACTNPAIDVSGGLGDDKAFMTGVDMLGLVENSENKTTCCQKCTKAYSGTQLTEYVTKRSNTCACFEAGANPTTTSHFTYAGICG